MATTDLSAYDASQVPSAEGMRFAVITSEWNEDITFALQDGAFSTLLKWGAKEEDISLFYVPGAFELIHAAKRLCDTASFNAVIVLGCVIQGGTPHFEYVCQGTTQGIAQVNAEGDTPVIYGVLTCNTEQEALDRCGGKLGNKGDEAAITAIKMVALSRDIRESEHSWSEEVIEKANIGVI